MDVFARKCLCVIQNSDLFHNPRGLFDTTLFAAMQIRLGPYPQPFGATARFNTGRRSQSAHSIGT